MAIQPPPPRVYFILGTPGAGRRTIVRGLIEGGLDAGEPALGFLAESETPDPADAALAALLPDGVQRWRWTPPVPPALPVLPGLPLPASAVAFFLADARASPIDQLEALLPWLEVHQARLARIFTVVDCAFAEKTPPLRPWFEACIHFSDAVFLTNRTGVANKWLSDFIQHFKAESYPCHFIQIKKGKVPNPALMLDPTPRRISQYFDEREQLPEVVVDAEDADDDAEAAAELAPPPEPYFERMRSGRRVKELPDIRHYLPGK